MHIIKLKAENVRNIPVFDVAPSSGVNLICGDNGSGKTTLLETIHLLSLGRSFRTHKTKRVISVQSDHLSVFALIESGDNSSIPVGVERSMSGDLRIRVAGDRASITDTALLLPVIILNQDAFLILSGGPKLRRQFLDFGLFHVKHNFITCWRKHQQVLRQRNAALRRCAPKIEIQSWDGALITATVAITEMRREYVDLFISRVLSVLQEFADIDKVSFSFYQGWSEQKSYKEILEYSINRDIELGYTYYGCHRADIYIQINKGPAYEFLSRGEQKLVVWAMRLTQGLLLKEFQNKQAIYLLDDLPSELDRARCEFIGNQLRKTETQMFVTAIEEEQIAFLRDDSTKVFHVKQGVVSEAQ